MNQFIVRYSNCILGVLSGFDRMLFRGTIRQLAYADGLGKFLNWKRIRLVDFGKFVDSVSEAVGRAAEQQAKAAGRPWLYLASASVDKDALARQHAVPAGLACVLRCVEPCQAFELHRNSETKHLEPRLVLRKCLHYYFYFRHPQFGWMHLRVQSWLPLSVRVYLNGREWLARQMTGAGLEFVQQDNCFTWVSDFQRAQQLAELQLRTNWVATLDELIAQVHPVQASLFPEGWPYYWSAEQTEWATDVAFRSPADLSRYYPHLVRHAVFNLSCVDVLRFLGRKVTASGQAHGNFEGEVRTNLKARPEGIRVKHTLDQNWLKMYDKQGSVLRVETTINNPAPFKVYRPAEGEPQGQRDWRMLRKGVADLHRRAEVSQSANDRYLTSLSTTSTTLSVAELAEPVCRRVRWHKRSVRALNPFSADDARLLQTAHCGEFAINGFRNRDLRPLLFDKEPANATEAKQQAAAVTRKLQLLRAHGLIHKVTKTHRYMLSPKGGILITALLTVRSTTTNLNQLAT